MCGVGDIDVARGAKASSPKEKRQVTKRPGPESVGLPYLRPIVIYLLSKLFSTGSLAPWDEASSQGDRFGLLGLSISAWAYKPL